MRRAGCGKSPGAIFSQTKLNTMLTEVQILDRAEGFADRFENRADGDKWFKRVTTYRLGAIWAKDQSEKELATLRAENARLKLAHENTWQALSRMVAKYEDVHTPAFLAFDEDFLAGRVALSSTKPDPIFAAAPEMLEALKSAHEILKSKNWAGGTIEKMVSDAIQAAEIPA